MILFKRKTKAEKLQELQNEVDELNERWKEQCNSYCKIGGYIFLLEGFKHDGKYVCIQFIDKDTPKGYTNYNRLDWWKLKYGQVDFGVARYQFIKFRDDLNKLGLDLKRLDK
jgi:hypothetical protein